MPPSVDATPTQTLNINGCHAESHAEHNTGTYGEGIKHSSFDSRRQACCDGDQEPDQGTDRRPCQGTGSEQRRHRLRPEGARTRNRNGERVSWTFHYSPFLKFG